jgi:CP family cyanate transporter-like MFS transporter
VRRGAAGALLALFLAALALRPQIVGAGPLFGEIEEDLDTSHAVVGLLGTIPVLCMGLFAPPAPYVAARLGTRAAMALAVALIGVFGVLRALAPGVALVVLLTWPIGVGMGIAGALAPVAVKERFAHRPGTATGLYTTGVQVGSAASAALAVPIAAAFGGWRASLLVFSVASCALAVAWLVLTRDDAPHARPAGRPPRLPWRSGTAWLLVGIFGLMASTYYGINSWVPDSLVERGWSESSAGGVLAALNAFAIPAAFLVPWLSDRHGGRRPWLVAMGCSFVVGVLGFALWAGGAWLWAAFAGMASGAMFPLVLTLPLDLEEQPALVGALVGMMLGVGYTIGAASPLVLGAVRDLTGSYTGSLWLIVLFCAGLLALVAALPRRSRGGRLAQPAG